MNDIQIAEHLLGNQVHMVLATADAAGKPWVSVVFFAHDDGFNLYWVSNKDARHSANIRERPQVGIVIFGLTPEGGVDGVYVDAQATELDDGVLIEQAIAVLRLRQQPDRFTIHSADDVTGLAAWRIYKAVSVEMSKRADAVDKASGQAITVRRPFEPESRT